MGFMENRKGNKVMKICDGITSYLKHKDYIMFDDNWISENHKILYSENGESFSVLDFQEVEEYILIMLGEITPHLSEWRFSKFSCVKLDKDVVNVGDVFYTYININNN